MEALGPHGLAVVVDLIDAIALGTGGIHIVVTDRPQAVRAELSARCPVGWVVAPLLSPERERLSDAVQGEPGEQGVLLVDVVVPEDAGERAALHALNDSREWLLRRGTCAVVIVAGKDARRADGAYLELQAHAPDFWSVRSRVHRVVGPDTTRAMRDELLDLLSVKLEGDRAAAQRWLDGRSVEEDWVTYRLWREGPRRAAWLELAEPSTEGEDVPMPGVDELLEANLQGKLHEAPVGEAIAPERWRVPRWPSGRLDTAQQSLVKELGAALDRDGRAELWVLPEDEASEALGEVVLTLGLLRESRYRVVLHLDARSGLAGAITTRLREAGDAAGGEGLLAAIRRLHGALGSADALLVVTDVTPTELAFLRAGMPTRTVVATVRGEPLAAFCVAASPAHADYAKWARVQLSAWPLGATTQAIRAETVVLDLRAALGRARHVIVLMDEEWSREPIAGAHPLVGASHRIAAFALEEEVQSGIVSGIPWYGVLGSDEATADGRLLDVARGLAGEPIVGPLDSHAPAWPSECGVTDAAVPALTPSQLDDALDEQRRAWSRCLEDRGYGATESLVSACERVAAALVVCGRVARAMLPIIVEWVTPTLADREREAVTSCLGALYGTPDDTINASIEPDVVGEALVERVIAQDSQNAKGLDRWLSLSFTEGMPHGSVTRLLSVLVRLAQRSPGREWLEQLLRERGPEIIARVERTANAGRAEPPGAVVKQAVELLEDGLLAETIGDLIPEATVELRDVEVAAYGGALRLAQMEANRDIPRMARLLFRVGRALGSLGKREEALHSTQEAVDVYRGLAEQRPDAFLPHLASALNSLGVMQRNVGQREGALRSTQEAIDVYRGLAEQQPGAFLPDLASALVNLGMMQSSLGRQEEALRATQEAVDSYRALAEQRSDAFLPDLARALNNLGVDLDAMGRREEALRSTQVAVDSYRGLAEQRPDAFLPDLAAALTSLGMMQSNLGRREEALRTTQEAVEIRRGLAEQRPDAFLPDLARALNNLGIRLSNLGRREEALRATQEAVEIRRGLAEQQPEAFLPELAAALNNLGADLNALGRREEALRATREAVEIRRGLAGQQPDAFLPGLARVLGTQGQVQLAAGSYAAAVESFAEGLRLVMPRAEQLSQAFRALALALARGLRRATEAGNLPLPDDLVPVIAALLEEDRRSRQSTQSK